MARRIKPSIFTLTIMLAIGLSGSLVLVVNWQQSRDVRRRILELTGLAPESVRKVVVYERGGRGDRKVISDVKALDEFTMAVKDARRYRPNHPKYIRSWYLDIETDHGSIGLQCHYEKGKPREVVCYFATTSGQTTYYHGTFVSTSLRPWFNEYIGRPRSDL